MIACGSAAERCVIGRKHSLVAGERFI